MVDLKISRILGERFRAIVPHRAAAAPYRPSMPGDAHADKLDKIISQSSPARAFQIIRLQKQVLLDHIKYYI